MTATKRLRAGVVGLGVGERHVVGYQQAADCEVVAIADLDGLRAQEVSVRHGVPQADQDWRTVTEHPDIDVVSICSYDDAHVEQAISALRHGKHVMIEKPIAIDRAEAERLLRVHQDHPELLITSNLILRASPRFRRVKAMADAGEFGRITYMEGDYLHDILYKLTEGWRGRLPGYSVIYGGGVHLIDLMRWIIGEEVTHVSGMGSRLLLEDSHFPGDDTTVNLFRFASGALAKCTTTLGPTRPKFHRLDVYGSDATFVNGYDHGQLYPSDDRAAMRRVEDPYPGVEKGDLLADLINAIRTGGQPEVAAQDVFRVMDVCFAAEEAVRTGHTVAVRYSC